MPTPNEGTRNADPQRGSGGMKVPSGPPKADRDRGGAGDLRRLKIVAVVMPVFFVLTVELIRFKIIETEVADYGVHSFLAVFTVAAVIGFSFVMFHFIDRAQIKTAQLVADLRRRQREGHGLYDVLLRISNQDDLADVLAAVAGHARDLLGGDGAVVILNEATTRSVQLDSAPPGAAPPLEGVCISSNADESHGRHDLREECPVRSSPKVKESLQIPIHSQDRSFGEMWIGRNSAAPFTDRDRQFLSTLAGLASIAVTSARMLESERQGAVLAERERIARELHDSLAQVLGVTHLRLRALSSRDDVRSTMTATTELTDLADICEEAYHDVREAILDLREASRTDRSLLDSLRAYLEKYTQQCGIAASLETSPNGELELPPRSEIQVIRVIQEALTNVRKHSGAAAAVVRITQADGTAKFVVEDDGHGFDLDGTLPDRDGFGLHSMRERMELIGGTLRIDSAPGHGTRIIAELPGISARTPIPVDADGEHN